MTDVMMTDPAAIECFLLAGRATMTLRSAKTSAAFTYRVAPPRDHDLEKPIARWFLGVLSGPDNEADYNYVGIIEKGYNGLTFRLTRGSRVGTDSPSYKAFRYFFDNVISRHQMPPQLEVRHQGRCGRCGRALTTPQSIDTGLGPECASKMGVPWEVRSEVAPASAIERAERAFRDEGERTYREVAAKAPELRDVRAELRNRDGDAVAARIGTRLAKQQAVSNIERAEAMLADDSVDDLYAKPEFNAAWRAELLARCNGLRRERRSNLR